MVVDKGKQKEDWIQEEEVFLYKLYNISLKSSKPKTLKPTFIQDKINNLEKHIKFLQSPVKTVPFYLPPHYKSLQSKRQQDKQYWNKIAVEFLKQKHNTDITRQGFPIKMYIEGLLYKSYFIVLILQRKIIIGPTKKMVASYIAGDLVLLD